MLEDNIVLTARGISMTFPGVKALDNVDFTLRRGEIHALMGENGAGKSTLIKCLTGINDFESGEIRVAGVDGPVKNRSTLDAQKVGISTVYQEVNLCPNLSVAENLYIGREPMTALHTIDRRTMNKKADELVKRLDIKVDVTQNLENYSLAIQQMIAIARAVDMDCKVLILDEPTSSLDDNEVEKLFKMMVQLKKHGVGIIFVTHFLEQVYAVCDRITVLRNGALVGEYPVAELPRVKLVAAMMGKDFDDLASIKPEGYAYDASAPLEIEAKGLSHKGTIKPFDLDIHKGEVIGLTGLLAALIVIPFGQASIGWFALAALLAIFILVKIGNWYKRQLALAARRPAVAADTTGPGLSKRKIRNALIILGVLVFSKYFYIASMTNYFTFFLMDKFSMSVQGAQYALFAFLAASAAGTFIGGPVGDRIGRKYVIWGSILGAAPFTLMLPYAGLTGTIVLAVIIGLVISSAFSAILVYATDLMPGKVGMIAGVFFGLMFGLGGLGSAFFGWLADRTSIEFIFRVSTLLPLLGIITGFLPNIELKRDEK